MSKLEKSLDKFYGSFLTLTDKDVRIEEAGTGRVLEFPRRDIRISDRFWRSDGCYRSGKCCTKPRFDNVFSPLEWGKLNDIYKSLPSQDPRWLTVNGKPYSVWTEPGGHDCPHLTHDEQTGLWGCSIHLLNPIHCALPHLYLDLRNTRKPVADQYVNVTKRQFGRNWALGCPVTFTTYTPLARARDLLLFNRIRGLLIEFTGSADRVSQIIEQIESRSLLAETISLEEIK